MTPQRGRLNCIEARIQRVHLMSVLSAGHPTVFDPDKWRPLIMSFQNFYGLGLQIHDSTLANSRSLVAAPTPTCARLAVNRVDSCRCGHSPPAFPHGAPVLHRHAGLGPLPMTLPGHGQISDPQRLTRQNIWHQRPTTFGASENV